MIRLKSSQRCLNAVSSIFASAVRSMRRRTVPRCTNLMRATPSGVKMISRTSQDLIQPRSLFSGVNTLGCGGPVVTTTVVASCSTEVASSLPWQPTRASTNAIVVRVALLRILRLDASGPSSPPLCAVLRLSRPADKAVVAAAGVSCVCCARRAGGDRLGRAFPAGVLHERQRTESALGTPTVT
jgi:hypothetical protein